MINRFFLPKTVQFSINMFPKDQTVTKRHYLEVLLRLRVTSNFKHLVMDLLWEYSWTICYTYTAVFDEIQDCASATSLMLGLRNVFLFTTLKYISSVGSENVVDNFFLDTTTKDLPLSRGCFDLWKIHWNIKEIIWNKINDSFIVHFGFGKYSFNYERFFLYIYLLYCCCVKGRLSFLSYTWFYCVARFRWNLLEPKM